MKSSDSTEPALVREYGLYKVVYYYLDKDSKSPVFTVPEYFHKDQPISKKEFLTVFPHLLNPASD